MHQKASPCVYARPLSASEAAEWLGISTRLVLDMARDGRLPAKKVGHSWRFSQRKLAEFAGVEGELA